MDFEAGGIMTAEDTAATNPVPGTEGGWYSVSQFPSLPEVFRTVAVPKAGNPLRKLFAFVGCDDRIALADEQRIVEGLSQPLDGVAYGGLVDAEKLGGVGKRGAVLHGDKRLQGREVYTGKLLGQHGHSPPCKFSITSI